MKKKIKPVQNRDIIAIIIAIYQLLFPLVVALFVTALIVFGILRFLF